MSIASTTGAASATLKAYQDKISAQVQEAKARLEQVEAKAREKKAQAEISTINSLKEAKQNIDRRLEDLKKTNATYVAQARAAIDADVATFKGSIDQLAAKFKTSPTKP